MGSLRRGRSKHKHLRTEILKLLQDMLDKFAGRTGVECSKGKSWGSGFNSNGNSSNYGLPSDTEECGQY